MHEDPPSSPAYQLFMLALCVFALVALAIQTTIDLDPEVSAVLGYADFAVCIAFLFDFLHSLWRAPRRAQYFFSFGWLDLLSAIPALDVARVGRAARVVRIVRVLRVMRASRVIGQLMLERKAESTFLAVSLIAILMVGVCSIAVLHFESEADGNIKTAEDALWWAVTTVTTVGYGDRFPITTEGRLVATMLMFAGVGLFGTFSGFLAAWFLQPVAAPGGPSRRTDRHEGEADTRLT